MMGMAGGMGMDGIMAPGPRQIGDWPPILDPRQIGDGDGDRGFRALPKGT